VVPPKIPTRADTQEPTRERGPSGEDANSPPPPPDDTRKGLTPAPEIALPRTRTSERNIATSEMSPLQAEQLREAAASAPEEQLARV
jgi:hypothetical protein